MDDIKTPESLKPIPKKQTGLKKFVRWFTFILLVVILLFGYWKYYYTYSDGYRSGLLQNYLIRGIFLNLRSELSM
jgi:hypothetical protein